MLMAARCNQTAVLALHISVCSLIGVYAGIHTVCHSLHRKYWCQQDHDSDTVRITIVPVYYDARHATVLRTPDRWQAALRPDATVGLFSCGPSHYRSTGLHFVERAL